MYGKCIVTNGNCAEESITDKKRYTGKSVHIFISSLVNNQLNTDVNSEKEAPTCYIVVWEYYNKFVIRWLDGWWWW